MANKINGNELRAEEITIMSHWAKKEKFEREHNPPPAFSTHC